MPNQLLIIYEAHTGNTHKMAQAVAEGAPHVHCRVRPPQAIVNRGVRAPEAASNPRAQSPSFQGPQPLPRENLERLLRPRDASRRVEPRAKLPANRDLVDRRRRIDTNRARQRSQAGAPQLAQLAQTDGRENSILVALARLTQ